VIATAGQQRQRATHALARARGLVFRGRRHLELSKTGRIDVDRREGAHDRREKWRSGNVGGLPLQCLAYWPGGPREVSEGPSRRTRPQPKKLAAVQLPRSALRDVEEPSGPKPTTCRQARSRRRLDDRKVVRRRPRPIRRKRRAERGTVSKLDAGGFPTAPDGQSPEVVFQASARDVKRRL